jgi:hypothetical protein
MNHWPSVDGPRNSAHVNDGPPLVPLDPPLLLLEEPPPLLELPPPSPPPLLEPLLEPLLDPLVEELPPPSSPTPPLDDELPLLEELEVVPPEELEVVPLEELPLDDELLLAPDPDDEVEPPPPDPAVSELQLVSPNQKKGTTRPTTGARNLTMPMLATFSRLERDSERFKPAQRIPKLPLG